MMRGKMRGMLLLESLNLGRLTGATDGERASEQEDAGKKWEVCDRRMKKTIGVCVHMEEVHNCNNAEEKKIRD